MAARLLLGQKVLDDFLNFGGNFDIFVEKIRFWVVAGLDIVEDVWEKYYFELV